MAVLARRQLSMDGHGPRDCHKISTVDGRAETALAIAVGVRSCVGHGSTHPKQGVRLEKAERRAKVGVDKSPRMADGPITLSATVAAARRKRKKKPACLDRAEDLAPAS